MYSNQNLPCTPYNLTVYSIQNLTYTPYKRTMYSIQNMPCIYTKHITYFIHDLHVLNKKLTCTLVYIQNSQSTPYKTYHVLHTNTDLAITVKRPVETNNIGRITFVQHFQLSDNLVPDRWLDFQVDQLKQKVKGSKS